MAEPSEEPTNRQLLERIAQLEQQNATLFSLIADVKEGLSIFTAVTADEVRMLKEALGPVVNRVFPKLQEMQDQVNAIVPPCLTDPRIDMKLDERPS